MNPAATASGAACQAPSCHTAWLSATPASWWWRIGISAFLAMNTMTVGLAVNTSEASEGERRAIHLALLALTLAVFALLGKPLLDGLTGNARARRLSLEPLFALGLGGAFAASLLATWRGEGAVYYEVSSILLVIYSLGKVVTGEAEHRALQAVSLAAASSETCLVEDATGALVEKRVSEVCAGDLVVAPAGGAVAVDGIVERGSALCRVDAVTGESFLAGKAAGDAVPAGAVPADGALWVRASVAGGQRSLDQIAAAIERSRTEPSPLERTAARAALWLTPLVAGAAVLAGLFWWFRAGADAALMNGLAVLVIACPCALGFATPLALWAAMSRFALRGAYLRNGEALERIADCDLIVFDKTGTLTGVEPRLAAFAAAPGSPLGRAELLEAAAAVERLSGHPIARAFRGCAPEGKPRFDVRELRLLPGQGVAAEVRARQSGTAHELKLGLAEKLLGPEDAPVWEELREKAGAAPGARLLAVVADGRLAALAALEETPAPGVAELWEALRGLGIDSLLVSGDEEERVKALGHPDARASMQPLEKLALVRELRAQGRRVLFIGDGINDAAAMAESHAALAVESGAALAREVAHGVLRAEAVPRVAELVKIARAARRLARTNLAYAAAYNLTGIPVAAAGLLHPVFAALVMTCSSLMVVWRAAGFLAPDLEAQA
ncbi:MAG: copper-translocating P-type ATPase [Bryobacteraceae bacterium]|nr:MAG: copper-translocating P-type ATPase [Bryobacteraceae bacterium]